MKIVEIVADLSVSRSLRQYNPARCFITIPLPVLSGLRKPGPKPRLSGQARPWASLVAVGHGMASFTALARRHDRSDKPRFLYIVSASFYLGLPKDVEPVPSRRISGSTSAPTQLAQVRPGTWREPYPAQTF
ncbi:hypothetical protein B0H14DRAFT_2642146 [Mycena olivaceomarginata]|nr:hypothetical protein B0H14DRAFT_2642146 [Mycena olivaceomarginata]